MIYLLFVDADSDSIEKIAELIHHQLMSYPDMGLATITDGNHTLMITYRHSRICEENKNPRTYAIITYGINEYTDENRSNYNQRGVMSIETDDIVKYSDIMGVIDDVIQTPECEIEELHPMAYMDIDYEPEKLIDETIKSVYLKFTCRKEENKEGEKTGE